MTLEEIKKIPKVELHVHLDGSVNIELASKLLNKNIDEVKQEMIAYNTNDLNEYLQKFELPISIMQTKENLTKISEALALQLLSDNVIYGEIRFAPSFHAKEGLPYDEIITSVLEGLNKVKEVKINLILCLMRGSSEEDNLNIYIIADGMGGYSGGEVASNLAVLTVKKYIDDKIKNKKRGSRNRFSGGRSFI